MEVYSLIFLSFFIAAGLAFFLSRKEKEKKLPPGPVALPILGNYYWLTRSLRDIESILKEIKSHYGPIITLRIGSRPVIFVADHALAHETLIGKGATFADRPAATKSGRLLAASHQNINNARHGPLWRLLRRNLMSEILHPSRVKYFGEARNWVLELLIHKFTLETQTSGSVRVMESFQFSMFCLLVLMCFGQRLDEPVIREIEKAQRDMLLNFSRFNIIAFSPRMGKWVFRKRWLLLLELRKRQAEVLLPLIRARQETQMKGGQEENDGKNYLMFSYVDSLLSLEIPAEGARKLTEGEMLSLCSEFLIAGTDNTSTAMQWIMANIVKYPQVQEKIVEEIERIVRERKSHGGEEENHADFIKEEELQKMKYLKAVVMEALRRHPPMHFVLPHAVKEEADINGYIIPKGTSVNFMVAEMGMDEKVWKDPKEFKPERFLEDEEVDITGTREIKMMPFGAGRRICPGLGLAMLHLEWFVANLVKEFEWKVKDGEEVDLSEKLEVTIVMKNPLNVVLRRRKIT
ncbi:cytochrome P450 89A2-like [Aristolochia californica]|uniref:cytochrome P450 89A2-like n=1 Tax=Aristolochia californica TaxID=171875 RepID=UPI0035D94F09